MVVRIRNVDKKIFGGVDELAGLIAAGSLGQAYILTSRFHTTPDLPTPG
jgi:hypothetical protein